MTFLQIARQQNTLSLTLTLGFTFLLGAINSHCAPAEEPAKKRSMAGVEAARQILAGDPDNAAANETLGVDLAVFERNWKAAATHLAKASDPAWRKAGRLELAVPQTSAQQVDLADAWKEVAKFAHGEIAVAVLCRELYWSFQAANNKTSPLKKQFDDRQQVVFQKLRELGDDNSQPDTSRPFVLAAEVAARGPWYESFLGQYHHHNKKTYYKVFNLKTPHKNLYTKEIQAAYKEELPARELAYTGVSHLVISAAGWYELRAPRCLVYVNGVHCGSNVSGDIWLERGIHKLRASISSHGGSYFSIAGVSLRNKATGQPVRFVNPLQDIKKLLETDGGQTAKEVSGWQQTKAKPVDFTTAKIVAAAAQSGEAISTPPRATLPEGKSRDTYYRSMLGAYIHHNALNGKVGDLRRDASYSYLNLQVPDKTLWTARIDNNLRGRIPFGDMAYIGSAEVHVLEEGLYRFDAPRAVVFVDGRRVMEDRVKKTSGVIQLERGVHEVVLKASNHGRSILPGLTLKVVQVKTGKNMPLVNSWKSIEHFLESMSDGQAVEVTGWQPQEAIEYKSPLPRVAEFETLTAKPVTTLDVSEDGKLVFTCHQEENAVRVWSTTTGALIRTLPSKSPRCVLHRAGRLYVGSYLEPAIQVFQQDQNWSLVDELECGSDGIYHLTAPAGKAFAGVIVADCKLEGVRNKKSNSFAISVRQDSYKPVTAGLGVSQVDPAGRYLVTQGNYHMTGAATFATYDWKNYLNNRGYDLGKTAERIYRSPASEGFWVSDHGIWRGLPARLAVEENEVQMLADITRPMVYGLTNRQITGWSLGKTVSALVDKRVVKMPAAFQGGDLYSDYKEYRYYRPVAVTLGETLHIFALCPKSNSVFHIHIPRFQEEQVPAKVAADTPWIASPRQEFTRQLSPAGSTFQIITGPAGAKVSPTGLLSWTPTEEHIGVQTVKVKVTSDNAVTIDRIKIEVFRQRGDEAAVAAPVLLATEQASVQAGRKNQSMLLLEGNRLRILSADASRVVAERELPHACREIYERSDIYVGLGLEQLYLIDKQSLKVKKVVELGSLGTIRSIACDPVRRATYVVYYDGAYDRIARANEKTGKVVPLKNVVGTWAVVDPQGKHLFTGFKAFWRYGLDFPFELSRTGKLTGDLRSGSQDMLLKYSIHGAKVKLEQGNLSVGMNGYRIRMSVDGKRIVYLSHTGSPRNSGNVEVFKTEDVTTDAVRCLTHKVADCKKFEFHPVLDFAVSPTGNGAVLFNLKSGEALPQRIEGASGPYADMKIGTVRFSADGSRVVFALLSPQRGVLLRSVPLPLDAEQRKMLNKFAAASSSPPDDTPELVATADEPESQDDPEKKFTASTYPLAKLDALKGGRGKPMNTKAIVQWFINSVVVVKTGEGTGTGFIVGSDGYVMTCAHCLPERGDTTIKYRVPAGRDIVIKEAKAKVLQVDEERDMALLKINVKDRLLPVRLSAPGSVATGEDVCVIGNPGVGVTTLDYTVTEGIVSSARRKLEGQEYIQTSAAVNPGNSGGPMFNDHGLVIGVVVLKARIEGAGFAITPADVTSFLLRGAVTEGDAGKLVREFVDASGSRTLKAEILGIEETAVQLKNTRVGTFKLPFEKLSKGDHRFLKIIKNAKAAVK